MSQECKQSTNSESKYGFAIVYVENFFIVSILVICSDKIYLLYICWHSTNLNYLETRDILSCLEYKNFFLLETRWFSESGTFEVDLSYLMMRHVYLSF